MISVFKDEYYFLSNFELVDIEYNGMIFPSVEHAYMSEKCDDQSWKEYCTNRNVTPSDVKKNSKFVRLVNNWDEKKFGVMEKFLRIKFNKEPYRTKLLATGNQNIQEGNWWNDRIWGIDITVNPNIGENHLGRLLMKIRDELKNN